MRRWRLALVLALCSLSLPAARSQKLPAIQTDRPDQTETPAVVPKGLVQVELGFALERADPSSASAALPTFLLRYGVNGRFELRLESEFISGKTGERRFSGLAPCEIGAKVRLAEENGVVPLTSLIGHLSIPAAGSTEFRTSYYAPSFRFAMQHTLSDALSLGYNAGAEWDGESAEPTFLYTLSTGISLTETLGCYVELYGLAPQKRNAEHNFDGGLTWLMRPNVLLDVSGGAGLTADAPEFFVAVGVSFRLME